MTLPAYSDGVHLLVWCAYCRRYHVHGGGLDGAEGGGHRIAHCTEANSPYTITGYYLKPVGPAPKRLISDSQRYRPKGPAACLD